jgi:MFS family permease
VTPPADTPDTPPVRGSRLRRIAVDLTPLKVSRDYRLLWGGGFISELGYQFARIAIYVQVTELTGSVAAVGLVGLTGLAGVFAGTLIGGSFIDAHDRRRTLMWAQVAHTVGAAILLGGAIHGQPPVWLIYLAGALHALVSSIDVPTRSAMTPRLVGKELLPSALALSQVLWQTVAIVGPAVAGVVIARFGFGAAYAIDLVTYAALFFAALMMRPMPPEHDPERATGWPAVKEGFGYVRGNRLIRATFVVDLIAMIFGMPQALFTFLAISQFHRGLEIVGLLFAAPAVGALVQALMAGWVTNVRRQGSAVIWAVAAWGSAIAAFGLVGANLPLALLMLALAGAADVISAIFRSTITQVTTPDRLRGRMSQIFILVVTGGPRLGDFEAGIVAAWFTPTISVVSGGLACIFGAGFVALAYPELRRYRADPVA